MTFRINRKNVGCTWSCPVDKDENPIPSKEAILGFVRKKYGECEYVIAAEHHANGKFHYHALLKFDTKLDVKDANAFDIEGVHPNVIKPGKGWHKYCCKTGDYITNIPEDIWVALRKKRRWDDAQELLLEQKPELYFKFGQQIKRNFEAQLPPVDRGILYYGPWPKLDIDMASRTLVLSGKAGTGKTQWAKYIAKHLGEKWIYVKGCLDKAKRVYEPGMTVIFDDIVPYEKWTVNDWASMFDVENGGSINLRNCPLCLDPGFRIFIHNGDIDWPHHEKIARRVHIINTDTFLQ